MKKELFLITLFGALFVGCNSMPTNFTLDFTIESINNYKLLLHINSEKQYVLEEQRIFFDNFAKQKEPIITRGTLTDEEFATCRELIRRSRLFKMNDAYGFGQDEDDEVINEILYHITYQTADKEKYISIRLNEADRFPAAFIELMAFLNHFANANKGMLDTSRL